MSACFALSGSTARTMNPRMKKMPNEPNHPLYSFPFALMRVNIRFLKWPLVPVLGYIAFVLPVLISPPTHHYGAVLFQTYTDAYGTLGWANGFFLFLLGVALGFFVTKREGLTGCLSVVLLPILAVIEMIKDGTSHNLWPFEFVGYAIMAAVVVIGSLTGQRLRSLRDRKA